MVSIKTPQEIALMRESGRIAGSILKKTCEQVKVGVSTLELNNFAEKLMRQNGVVASFKTVNHYPFGTCININEGIVHGLPSAKVILKPGDLVKIDLGVIFQGWHSDAASTVYLPSGDEARDDAVQKFLGVGLETLKLAIDECQVGKKVSDISRVIETNIEVNNGYSVVYELTGHGLGQSLHEEPDVPGVLMSGGKDHSLVEGTVLAIEIIYSQGSGGMVTAADNWTISTKDHSLAGLFEHSVAVTAQGPLVLTTLN